MFALLALAGSVACGVTPAFADRHAGYSLRGRFEHRTETSLVVVEAWDAEGTPVAAATLEFRKGADSEVATETTGADGAKREVRISVRSELEKTSARLEVRQRARVIDVVDAELLRAKFHDGKAYVYHARAVDPPVAIRRFEPRYRREVLRGRHSSTAIVELLIDETGTVREATLLKPLYVEEVDRAIVEAVKEWTFRPAAHGGRPVPVVFNTTIIPLR